MVLASGTFLALPNARGIRQFGFREFAREIWEASTVVLSTVVLEFDQIPAERKAQLEQISHPYDDPKVADNTPAEAAKYDERAAQIARELLYAFSLARQN